MQGGKIGGQPTGATVSSCLKNRVAICAQVIIGKRNDHNPLISILIRLSTLTEQHLSFRKMSSIEELPKPSRVTGGCLCGAVRYRLDFPPDYDFAKNVSKLFFMLAPVRRACKLLLSRPLMMLRAADWHLSMHPVPPQLGGDLLVLHPGPKGLREVAQCERADFK